MSADERPDYLRLIRGIVRCYENVRRGVCAKYRLTRAECDIIAFLCNHPELDTATDIVNYRMLQKGNVSAAVDDLIARGYLCRSADQDDRRRVRLNLTDRAAGPARDVCGAQDRFIGELLSGFTEDERREFSGFCRRIGENAERRNAAEEAKSDE